MLDPHLLALKDRITFHEAAHYLYDVSPSAYPNYIDIPEDIQQRIEFICDVLIEEAKKGNIKGYRPHYDSGSPPPLSMEGLKAWAKQKGFNPKCLFPEQQENFSKQKPKVVFPCTLDTTWCEISITLIADDAVKIKTPQGEGRFNYSKLDMNDGRKGDQPTQLWELLKIFIKNKGAIYSQNPNYDPKLPDTAKRLNKHLQTIFGIKGSIYTGHYKKEKGYKLQFMVKDLTFS